MKHYYSLCFLSLFISSFSSQTQIALIPKAGMSRGIYKLTTNWLSQTASPGLGLTAGMGVAIPTKQIPWLSFQPEVNYVQKAVTFSQTSSIPKIGFVSQSQTARRNHFLGVPLLAKARLGKQAVQGFIHAGPSVGLLLGSKTKLTIDRQPIEITPGMAAPRIGKATNSLELGLQVGGGVGLTMGPGTFLLEARYGAGLINFVKKHQLGVDSFAMDQTVFIPIPADEKSRTFLLTGGYAIPLKK